jgi:hypothetical protein
MEAHIIANKDKIQTKHFNLQDHVHSVLGQKTCSASDFLTSGLNSQHRCLLRHMKLHHAIQNKRCGMLSWRVIMCHDNACPDTATATQDLIATFGWEQFDYPPPPLPTART